MTKPAGVDWIWFGGDAIDEFKKWRINAGATTASASSYATGARVYVRHCRRANLNPNDAVDSFKAYLDREKDLTEGSRSD